MKKYLAAVMLSLALVIGSMTGCATLSGDGPNSADDYFKRYQHIMRLAVQVGVINLLDVNSTYDDKLMAMTNVIDTVIEAEANNVLDLGDLQQLVIDRIDWSSYAPTERLLVEALLGQIAVEVKNTLEADCQPEANQGARALCFQGMPEVPEKVKLYVGTFTSWIREGIGTWRASNGNRDFIPVLPPVK